MQKIIKMDLDNLKRRKMFLPKWFRTKQKSIKYLG